MIPSALPLIIYFMKFLLSDEDKYPMLWKLMGAYLTIGFIGFCLIFFCLDRIGARVYPEKTGFQVVTAIILNTIYFGIFEKHFALAQSACDIDVS